MQAKLKADYKKASAALKQLGIQGHKAIDDVLAANVLEMVARAKTLAPKNDGYLHQSINFKKIREANYEFYVNAPYAPYMEFGTGTLVQVPAELSQIAAQYRGKGRGTFQDLVRNIRDWARKKGIPEEAAFPIALKIVRVGVRPQPFFYPSIVKQRPQLVKDMQQALKKLSNG